MPNLNINGRNMSVEAAGDTPLLLADFVAEVGIQTTRDG